MARKRRTWKYTGVLAEPMVSKPPLITPPGADPEKPPQDWVRLGCAGLWRLSGGVGAPPENWLTPEFATRVWREAVLAAKREDARASWKFFTEWQRRLSALYDHFGIDQWDPHSALDLALSLALRHEPEFVDGRGRACLAALKHRYSIHPDTPYLDLCLAMDLAEHHVPGFAARMPKPPGRHKLGPMLLLLSGMAAVQDHVRRNSLAPTGKEGHCVADILLDQKRLGSVVSPEMALKITKALSSMGNHDRGMPRPLSERAVRDYYSKIQTRWADYLADRANSFQLQLLFWVEPIVDRALAVGEGDASGERD